MKSVSYNEWYNSKIEKFGKEKVIADEKMIKNKAADQKQYSKYKALLGEDAPNSLAKFQDLKYNNSKDMSLMRKILLALQRERLLLQDWDIALETGKNLEM